MEEFKIFDENYKIISENIAVAAERSGRKAEDITLLAATKTVSAEVINHAIESGIKVIGENRVQEFTGKYDQLLVDRVDCHFIGQLQTNKVKYIVDKVSTIHSVDSVKLAKQIARLATAQQKIIKVLVEVNIGIEESKGGVLPQDLFDFVEEIRGIEGLKIEGLMTIPPISKEKVEIRNYFSKMRQYFVDITEKKLDNVNMNILSMGMSDDYMLAIEEGSNLVRIGSALFGSRKY